MTPEKRATFYEAMYRAKCQMYDELWREVEALIKKPEASLKCGATHHPRPGEVWVCDKADGHDDAHSVRRVWS